MQKKQIIDALPSRRAPGLVMQVVASFRRMNHERMCLALGELVALKRLEYFDKISEKRLDSARAAKSGSNPQTIEFRIGENYDREAVAAVLGEFDLKFEIVDFGNELDESASESAEPVREELAAAVRS